MVKHGKIWYFRVKLKGKHPFWAKVDKRGKGQTLYIPVDKDGEDFGHWGKDGITCILKKTLVDNRLIEYEKPAMASRSTGELAVIRK